MNKRFFSKIMMSCLILSGLACDGNLKMQNKNSVNIDELMTDNNGANDFDFLQGKDWKINNRVLSKRLSNNNDWTEFEASFGGYQKIAGGYGNIDHFKGERNGTVLEASSIRVFDKNAGEWSIYWIDNNITQLVYQVTGKFEGKVGTFYGEEPFNGQMTKLRFLWTVISENQARWEQAYYDNINQEWETNWIMNFEAVPE